MVEQNPSFQENLWENVTFKGLDQLRIGVQNLSAGT